MSNSGDIIPKCWAHRIRRITAEAVLQALRQPAIKVADGVANAACGSIRSLIARLRVVNHELRSAMYKLDEICADLDRSPVDVSCGDSKLNDIAILKSMPGIGRINLAILLAEASGPLSRRDYQALRTLSGVAPVTKQSGKSRVVVRRYAAHARLGKQFTIGHVSPFSTIPRAAAAMQRCVIADILMVGPSAASLIDC